MPTPPLRLTCIAAAACFALGLAAAAAASDKPGHPGAAASPHAEAPAAPAAASAPAAAQDPMERLRERLTRRLSAASGPSREPTGSVVVTVPKATERPHAAKAASAKGRERPLVHAAALHGSPGHDAGPAPRARPARAASTRTVPDDAHAAPAAGGGHGPGGHWAYEGPTGPASWAALKPEFSACATGQRQSPIDIRGGLAVDLAPVRFDYQPSSFTVVDNGHTVQVNLPPGNSIEVAGTRYELLQFHFHRPSEERIDGRQFAMSLHLVHKDAAGRLAVVGVLLDKGPAHPAVQLVWNNLPLERQQEQAANVQIDPTDLLPTDRRYYTYMGSLTTPPCSEGVRWVVMRTPVSVTPAQVDLFSRLYPMNARPVQSAAGRRIMQSN